MTRTKDQWLELIAVAAYRPKPPLSWLYQQELNGRRGSESARVVFAIWHKYPAARKMTIWATCDDVDFEAAGMQLRKEP
jgi:hypothetical protein